LSEIGFDKKKSNINNIRAIVHQAIEKFAENNQRLFYSILYIIWLKTYDKIYFDLQKGALNINE